MVAPTDEVLAVLRTFHPSEHPPRLLEATTPPATITADVLSTVLKAVPRGSAAGPSGWTCEQVYASMCGCPDAEAAVLDCLVTIVQGKLP
jgi:hypothetical protein